jgi:K+-sensing histidine kinase KdpD
MEMKRTFDSKRAYLAYGDPAYKLPGFVWAGRMLTILRWLALVLVLVLSLFDRLTEGVIVSPLHAVAGFAVYSALLFFASRYLHWLRRPLFMLAFDTVAATLATYLTGGYHSGFFILYVFNIIGAAFYMDLVPTILVAIIAGFIYAGASAVNPAGLWKATSIYIVSAKLLLIFVVAVLCALLLEQLRSEHKETEKERILAARLGTLNELLRQISTSLDLDRTFQTVTDAASRLLSADVAYLLLLDEKENTLAPAAMSGVEAQNQDEVFIPLDEEPLRSVLGSDAFQVISEAAWYADFAATLPGGRGIISCASAALRLGGEPLGLLVVGQRIQTTFESDALTLLPALAQEAALAIRNARLYQREKEQVQKLRMLDELQHSFISVLSHELRTPLTCIKTSVDLYPDATEEVKHELLETIDHHTHRLEALLADLVESTRLEVGQVILATQPTDARRIVERTVSAVAPLLEKKGQHLEIQLPDRGIQVDIDRRRIDQALTNLLVNAHKFTPKGGRIRVSMDYDDGEVVIAICDTGPGIPAEEQANLFQRFFVLPGESENVGLGLGLFITREYVALHGGRVWLESEPDRGSTFFIALPALKREGP